MFFFSTIWKTVCLCSVVQCTDEGDSTFDPVSLTAICGQLHGDHIVGGMTGCRQSPYRGTQRGSETWRLFFLVFFHHWAIYQHKVLTTCCGWKKQSCTFRCLVKQDTNCSLFWVSNKTTKGRCAQTREQVVQHWATVNYRFNTLSSSWANPCPHNKTMNFINSKISNSHISCIDESPVKY